MTRFVLKSPSFGKSYSAVVEIFWQDLHWKALVLVNSTVLEIFWQDLYRKALVLVNPTVVEIFWQDLYRKALVLVNPTVVEIFWQDFSTSYKSPNFGNSYSSM